MQGSAVDSVGRRSGNRRFEPQRFLHLVWPCVRPRRRRAGSHPASTQRDEEVLLLEGIGKKGRRGRLSLRNRGPAPFRADANALLRFSVRSLPIQRYCKSADRRVANRRRRCGRDRRRTGQRRFRCAVRPTDSRARIPRHRAAPGKNWVSPMRCHISIRWQSAASHSRRAQRFQDVFRR